MRQFAQRAWVWGIGLVAMVIGTFAGRVEGITGSFYRNRLSVSSVEWMELRSQIIVVGHVVSFKRTAGTWEMDFVVDENLKGATRRQIKVTGDNYWEANWVEPHADPARRVVLFLEPVALENILPFGSIANLKPAVGFREWHHYPDAANATFYMMDGTKRVGADSMLSGLKTAIKSSNASRIPIVDVLSLDYSEIDPELPHITVPADRRLRSLVLDWSNRSDFKYRVMAARILHRWSGEAELQAVGRRLMIDPYWQLDYHFRWKPDPGDRATKRFPVREACNYISTILPGLGDAELDEKAKTYWPVALWRVVIFPAALVAATMLIGRRRWMTGSAIGLVCLFAGIWLLAIARIYLGFAYDISFNVGKWNCETVLARGSISFLMVDDRFDHEIQIRRRPLNYSIAAEWYDSGRHIPTWRYSNWNLELESGTIGGDWTAHAVRFVRIPVEWLAVAVALPGVLWLLVTARTRARTGVRRRRGLCVQCGYDLRYLSNRCPECGAGMVSRVKLAGLME